MTVTVIAGNWKMNKTPAEAVELARQIASGLPDSGPAEVVICPTALSIESVSQAVAGRSPQSRRSEYARRTGRRLYR